MTRREVLRLAVGASLLAIGRRAYAASTFVEALASAPWRVVTADGSTATDVVLVRSWSGGRCHSRLVNHGRRGIPIKEVVLADVRHGVPPETPFYGEGFQMLSQTGGTIGSPVDLGNYTDPKHYKLPEPEGAKTAYGVVVFGPAKAGPHEKQAGPHAFGPAKAGPHEKQAGPHAFGPAEAGPHEKQAGPHEHIVLAFGSCRRFNGKFNIRPASIEAVVDGDGVILAPGEQWDLEELLVEHGADREALLERVAARLTANHPPLRVAAPPSGWCSWYCFGPSVTARQVLDNLDVIAREIPGLKYIQIDDGYQPAMGDWLETGKAFGGNVRDVLLQIRKRGFEPAIWVAPFIAEKGSHLFQHHPDWFVKDTDGTPLRADKVTFGGWRRGPWYAVDGTHPGAQKHLAHVFETMRREWGCTYFKLDANFWGAIHGGRFHDPKATRIEAYRRGMEAVLRGAGDAFILGCNHPIWASAGLIHGSRSSNDIKRTWERIATTGRQNLYRNWQNGRLWWNDPDAVVLTGDLPDEEFRFHASVIYATGGMVLSGDDLTTISPERLAMLRKLQPPTGVAARFADESLRVGIIDLDRYTVVCFFNWSDAASTSAVTLNGTYQLRDFWTDEDRGQHAGGRLSVTLPARAARLLVCSPVHV